MNPPPSSAKCVRLWCHITFIIACYVMSCVDIRASQVRVWWQTGRNHLQSCRGGGRSYGRSWNSRTRKGPTCHHGISQRLRGPPCALPGYRVPTVGPFRGHAEMGDWMGARVCACESIVWKWRHCWALLETLMDVMWNGPVFALSHDRRAGADDSVRVT